MAKKKASKGEATADPKPNILVIRGAAAWREWLKRYAAFRRTTPTGLIDTILAEAARRDKFETPPERI
jgi:hypothetical protein